MNKKEGNIVKKRKMTKRIIIVSAILLFVIILLAIVITGSDLAFKSMDSSVKALKSERIKRGVNKVLVEQDEDGYWNLKANKYNGTLGNKNDETHSSYLKVLHLTDIHIGSSYFSIKNDIKSLQAVKDMIEWAEPDLIIITGDVIYPVPISTGTINNAIGARSFAKFMDKFQIPWAFTYGNHDTESYGLVGKDAVSKIFQEHKYNGKDKFCLYQEGPSEFVAIKGGEKPMGNYPILLRDAADNKLKHVFMIMDSNKYNKESEGPPFFKYDNIHADQSEWYKKTLIELSEKNGYTKTEPVTSSLYFHIPIKQYKEAWQHVTDNRIKSEEDKRKKVLFQQSEVKYFGGDTQEYTRVRDDCVISCSTLDAPIWDRIQELKSTKFLFCGHDHDNNFSIEYQDVRLTYGKSIDYQAYPGITNRTFQRGGTLILATGESGKDALKIYQKKLAMLGKEQISSYNSVKDKMEDVYVGTENPKRLMHPMDELKMIVAFVLLPFILLAFYPIARKVYRKKKGFSKAGENTESTTTE